MPVTCHFLNQCIATLTFFDAQSELGNLPIPNDNASVNFLSLSQSTTTTHTFSHTHALSDMFFIKPVKLKEAYMLCDQP